MSTELALPDPEPPDRIPARHSPGTPPLLEAFLRGLSPSTLRAYSGDLASFATWSVGYGSTAAEAIERLLALSAGDANGLALRWLTDMQSRDLSSATIARRLAALKSVLRLARTLGRITWSVEIRAPKREARRDVRGPDAGDQEKALIRVLKDIGDTPQARRDLAAVRLMFDLGLRRGEVCALTVADLDLSRAEVLVRGKGRSEKERLTLPDQTVRALSNWLAVRAPGPGPVFTRLDRGSDPSAERTPLTGDALARVVARIGKKAKLARRLRPHGIRHWAITTALDQGLDVRKVRLFSRHKKIETVMHYDDRRSDEGGKVAKAVASKWK